jgi:hypothetical protein
VKAPQIREFFMIAKDFCPGGRQAFRDHGTQPERGDKTGKSDVVSAGAIIECPQTPQEGCNYTR